LSSSTDGGTPGRTPIAYIVRAHGIKGDVLIKPLTERLDRFVVGAAFCVNDGPEATTVREVRVHNEGLILSFDGVTDRTAAERFAKQLLTIDPSQRRNLETGEYWPDDLVGLRAVDATGSELGLVTDVILGAAQDRLVVTTTHGIVEVPFVAALVGEPRDGVIPMDPPDGMFGPAPSAQVEEDA